MKNNTKVRLHLSKQLFESLTKEIIKEAKANDGYTVAVKQPKQPKQSKSQAASPEVQKTDAEAMMGEMETNVNEIGSEGIAALIGLIPGLTLTAALIKDITKYMKSNKLTGIDGFKKAYQAVGKDASAHMDKVVGGNQPGEKAGQVNPAKTFGPQEGKSDKAEMDTKKMSKEAIDFDKAQDYTYRLVDGNCIRINPETQERTKVHHTYCNDLKREMETKVAEEGQLDEFTGTETESSGAIAMIAAALGMGIPLATALVKDLMKAKSPEEKKQIIQKKLADKNAGMDKGTDALKEYEQHYEIRNGECRRYNDEGDYEVVSMHHCR